MPHPAHAVWSELLLFLSCHASGLAFDSQEELTQNYETNHSRAMQKLRAALFEIELDKKLAGIRSARALHVGTRSRSEKIRTYNFVQVHFQQAQRIPRTG